MTKVWRVRNQLSEDIALVARKHFDYSAPTVFFDGTLLADRWVIPEMHLNPDQPGARVVDFPFFEYGALLCSERAWSVLRFPIQADVELLPVRVDGFDYRLLNPIRVIDCLDKAASVFSRYKTGRVTDIHHYAFDEEQLNGVLLFKTPELRRTEVYATERFRDLVLSHELTGLTFQTLPK